MGEDLRSSKEVHALHNLQKNKGVPVEPERGVTHEKGIGLTPHHQDYGVLLMRNTRPDIMEETRSTLKMGYAWGHLASLPIEFDGDYTADMYGVIELR